MIPQCHPISQVNKPFPNSIFTRFNRFSILVVRNRYRTPITSASVLETLLEPPKSNATASLLANAFLPGDSSSSGSSSSESLRSIDHNAANAIDANAIAAPNDGETISWNWNPHQLGPSARSESKRNATQYDDYLQRISNDYYDRTLDKLMGEFSLNKRKRNWDRNLSRHCANDVDDITHRSHTDYDSSMWPPTASITSVRQENDFTENARNNDVNVKDVNFWTNVFFSGDTSLPDPPRKSNAKSQSTSETVNEIASMPSTSSSAAAHRTSDGKVKKVDNMKSSNTAFLLNNVISKLNEQSPRSGSATNRANKIDSSRSTAATQSKYEFEPISRRSQDASNHFSFSSDAGNSLLTLPPSYTLLNVIKPRSLLPKRKNNSNSYSGDAEHLSTSIGDAASTQRYSAATDSTFLQTLSELHFDHNDLLSTSTTALSSPRSAATSRHRDTAGQSKQKERYACSGPISVRFDSFFSSSISDRLNVPILRSWPPFGHPRNFKFSQLYIKNKSHNK